MAGHILLAEDDKALSALMQDFFRAAGVQVTPAYDGGQALALAQDSGAVFAETVPLTLEEIFISETEVAGYDIKDFIY